MPYKLGGGNHLQYYDEENGKYSDETKTKLMEKDKENLALLKLFDIKFCKYKLHFPNYNIHDVDYCIDFVEYFKNDIKNKIIIENKLKYLLTYNENNDKSKFLISMGYNIENLKELYNDIILNTDFKTIKYKDIDKYGLRVKAKTILKGKTVTTGWMFERNFNLRFLTLIPGGDKEWN